MTKLYALLAAMFSFDFGFWTLAKYTSFHWMLALLVLVAMFLYSDRPWQELEKMNVLQQHGYDNAVEELTPQIEELQRQLGVSEEETAVRDAQITKLIKGHSSQVEDLDDVIASARREANRVSSDSSECRASLANFRRSNDGLAGLVRRYEQQLGQRVSAINWPGH